MRREKTPLHEYHLFLDEAGDATFFESGGNRLPIAGQEGVSGIFMLGMVQFHSELHEIRQRVADKQVEIANSIYFRKVYSVAKREQKGGFYFHAKDDPPDLRTGQQHRCPQLKFCVGKGAKPTSARRADGGRGAVQHPKIQG